MEGAFFLFVILAAVGSLVSRSSVSGILPIWQTASAKFQSVFCLNCVLA